MHEKRKQLLISIFILISLLSACIKSMANKPASSNYFFVGMDEEFKLKKGQRVQLLRTGLEIEILNFFNQPFPQNVKCVWSGIGIEFEYRFHGQVKRGINLVKTFGYKTTVIESDYEFYAVLKITQDID